jgi:spore cortex formation protein SpoVR/YcgB (stage V sporulation)
MESELNKKKGGRKTTVVNYEERIPEAIEMMLYQKLNYVEFREQGAKKWGISERATEDLWKDVKSRLKARFDEKSDEIIEAQLSRYFDLLKRCRDSGNKRIERETLADINKLYGLEIKKVDVTSQGEKVSININLND